MSSKTSVILFVMILFLGLPVLTGYTKTPSKITQESLGDFVIEITDFWMITFQSAMERLLTTINLTSPSNISLPIITPQQPHSDSGGETLKPTKIVEVYDTGSLGLRVRTGPSLAADISGNVFDGTQFIVVTGPQSDDDYHWFKLLLEGWSAANWLSGELSVDAIVLVKDTGNLGLRVRDKGGLDGDVLGKVYDETRLLILEGPISVSGLQWWKIRLEGWSADRYLREPIPPVEDFVRPTSDESELPSAEQLQRRIESLKKILTMDTQAISLPSEGFTLQRWLAPNIIERSDQFYFQSLDYNILAVKSLHFAEDLLESGEIELASEYIERACSYIKLSDMLEDGSIEQLLASVDISQDLVIAMAAKTALRFTIDLPTDLQLLGHFALNIFTTYVDYSIDTGVRDVPIEIAAREQLTEFIVKGIFMIPAVRDAIGEPVTEFVGKESGLYQRLEQVMISPEVREEIMRSVARWAEFLVIESAEYDASYIANKVVDRFVELVSGS